MSGLGAIGLLAQEATTQFHADHTWLPEGSELVWGTLAFVIIALALWKYAANPVRSALRSRTERIAKELESAASERTAAEAGA
jgi:F0F1-type ATP synthase membrane subunit b/b'